MTIFKVEDYYYHIPYYVIKDIPLLLNAYNFHSGKIINTSILCDTMDIILHYYEYNDLPINCNLLELYHIADYFMYADMKTHICYMIAEYINNIDSHDINDIGIILESIKYNN